MGRALRALKGWNLFRDAPQDPGWNSGGRSMSHRQQRSSRRYFSDKSIVGAIYTRMAVDFSGISFMHVNCDEAGIATSLHKGDLHDRLNLDPNIDQTSPHFLRDFCTTLFNEGIAAIVPVDCDLDPTQTEAFNIRQLRVANIVSFLPQSVVLEVYDDRVVDEDGNFVDGGVTKQMTLDKRLVVIVENPFYGIMNEPNGLLQRLLRKLAILDSIDEASGSGKLDLIFQLPYAVRSESREKQAEARREALAQQLKDDELGIGYIDVSEKVIQLNRPVENKLIDQIELLFAKVYTELGITDSIMNGSADRNTINNYYDRTIEPIANELALEIKRKFLSKTARTKGQSIEIYRDPLKLIPLEELAEVVDKLLRNAAITANEIRPKIGFMPSSDPRANQLSNPNMPDKDQGGAETEVDPLEEEAPSDRPPVPAP